MQAGYAIKRYIGNIQISPLCQKCKATLKNFKKSPLTKDDAILIIPSKEPAFYHIARISIKNLKDNTQIIQDLKEEKV